MSLIRASLFSLATLLALNAAFADDTAKTLIFNADTDQVDHFADLPPDGLALLRNDREEFPDGPPTNLRCTDHELDAWKEQVLCRIVPLSPIPGTNYLVIGVGALRGAHIVPFWIIHQDSHGTSILFKTRSDAISVLPKTTNGFRELSSNWVRQAGAIVFTSHYRFNGKTYVEYSSTTTRN